MKKILIFTLFSLLFLNSKSIYAQTLPDTLNGVVDEYEFDNDGVLKSVVFNVLDADFNTESYIVENDATGKQLLELVGENIDVIGITKKNPDGTKSIMVKEIIISEEDDYTPPDDQDEEQ